jgi:hypothetical protein
MSKAIKLVYSWIGPKGPMINTELPNILSFAAVAEGTNTTSHKFWSDDLWWRVFFQKGNYELASTFAIDNRDTYIYPYTLTWRIPFGNYFCGNSGLFEFSHTPDHIIHHVRQSKGYFLIDCTAEAWVQDQQLDMIHSYFSHFNQIPMGKIIYLTGCMNAQDVYNRWCEKRQIPDIPRERMIMISFPISQSAIATNIWQASEPEYDTQTVPEKTFLCWNRRFRKHRTTLALALDKEGLVDRSYYSMGLVDPEVNSQQFSHTVDLYTDPFLTLTQEGAEKFMSKLPLKIDEETQINQMCQDFDAAARPFYQNSLVSVVTETNFENLELTLTEKSFKPSKEKHPFIIVGVPGALKALKEMGFQTFDEFWDETYDQIHEPKARLRKIVEVCKDIGSWDNDKILDFKRRVKPILENNYQAVQQNTAKMVARKIEEKIEAWRW